MSGQEAKENFLINGLKSDGKKRQKTTQQIFLGGEKKLFCMRSDKHKFEIKMKIKLIGAIEGVLLNWKISRNCTECCPKSRKGSTENGNKAEKQT